jgi:hypothetical protein
MEIPATYCSSVLALVHLFWVEEDSYVSPTANTSAQSTETDGRCFCDDGVGDRSHSTGEDERNQGFKNGLGVVGSMVLTDRSTDAQQDEVGDVDGCAPEVDGAMPEPGGEEPGSGVGNKSRDSC